jgi:aminoglycoside phosphotransferase (APT) family kinase protein
VPEASDDSRDEIPGRLLAYLQASFESPNLTYAEPPTRITGGFDTFIYGFRLDGAPPELAGDLILRLSRDDNPWIPLRTVFERTVQNVIAALAYPAPRVFDTCTDGSVLGAPFLIMEKLRGRSMLDMLFRPSRIWLRLPAILAETQARLHALDPDKLLAAVDAEGLPRRVLTVGDWLDQAASVIDRTALDGLRPGLAWLGENQPSPTDQPVICHGDFHPLNILMLRGQVTGVLDWPGVKIAEPAYDVGATIAIFTQGPVNLPQFLSRPVNAVRRWLIGRYYRTYQRLRPVDEQAVRYYEALRCLDFLIEAGMHRRAEAGVISRPEKPTALGSTIVVRRTAARFETITGVRPELPKAR